MLNFLSSILLNRAFILRFVLPSGRWLRSMRYCFRHSRTMFGDDGAEIEDTDQIGELLDFDDPAGAVGHTIIVAADRDGAIVADVPFQFEHGVAAMLRQRLQFRLLGRESLADDPLAGRQTGWKGLRNPEGNVAGF